MNFITLIHEIWIDRTGAILSLVLDLCQQNRRKVDSKYLLSQPVTLKP